MCQQDLPSDLAGVNTIPFKEPTDLTSRAACSDAIAAPAAQVKNVVQQVVQRDGPAARGGRQPVLSVLSVDEVLRRERPVSQDGDLAEDRVIVIDTVPAVDVDRAKLVYNNIQYGNSYHYLYYYSADTLDKICHLLQMVAWAAVTQDAEASLRLPITSDEKSAARRLRWSTRWLQNCAEAADYG